MSNNVGEYAALHAGLQAFFEHVDQFPGEWNVFDLHKTLLQVRGDSQLVINQMSNVWKARDGLYLPYYEKAAKLCRALRALGVKITFDWVPRELNKECDGLSKNVILTKELIALGEL